jgi:hypothetical protein
MATLNINGRDVTVDVPADMPILWVRQGSCSAHAAAGAGDDANFSC